MPVKRPIVVSLAQLEQAAQNASMLALDERQLATTSGGALAISKLDPGTTMGMMPPEPLDPSIVFSTSTLS